MVQSAHRAGASIPRRSLVAGVTLGASALAFSGFSPIFGSRAGAATVAVQWNWRWCSKCQVLAFNGSGTLGSCPAGGQHDHAYSGNYCLAAAASVSPPAYQLNWWWCVKCQALTFGGAATGPCPAGGQHAHAGGEYAVLGVPEGERSSGAAQVNWRWCRKCQVLAFNGAGSLGACAAGGSHDHSGSGNYALAGELVQDRWRYCGKCRSLVTAATSCAGGGQHQLGSTNYCVPYDNYQLANAQENWFWCVKCTALFYSTNFTQSGHCPSGGYHDATPGHGLEATHYQVISGVAPGPADQDNWRWCAKCMAMVFAGAPTPGYCPNGGQHSAMPGPGYVLGTAGRLPTGGGGTSTPGKANLAFSGPASFDSSSGSLVVPFTNNGGSASGAFSVRLLLDSADSRYLQSASLSPGQSEQATLRLADLNPGQHDLVVVLDALSQVAESSEGDNEKTIYFSIDSMGFVYITTP